MEKKIFKGFIYITIREGYYPEKSGFRVTYMSSVKTAVFVGESEIKLAKELRKEVADSRKIKPSHLSWAYSTSLLGDVVKTSQNW